MNPARFITILTMALTLAACDSGGAGQTSPDVTPGPDAGAAPDALSEDTTIGPDTSVPPDIAPDLFPDLSEEDIPGTPNCAPGEGCFLDPCSENSQCQSGYCVEHMGDGVCTQVCESECPAGWSCQQVGSGPDLVFACISAVANLCRPCATGADCKSPGGAEDVCVSYGDEGSFCGASCQQDEDCPWGFSCVDAVTVDGIEVKQCLADAGVCPCAGRSVELALWTPCTLSSEWGSCLGKRVCTEEGLGDCDAMIPAAEICNGVDDDCDDETDEPVFLDGEWQDLCHDGNECTLDQCLGAEGCVHEVLEGTECKDGNPCTVADHCVEGLCIGTPVDCDDQNPCTDDSCDEAGGCVFEFNTADCDDGDPCTVADECLDGLCAGVAVDCDCTADEDCQALEDGDICNGTLLCDTDLIPHRCVVDPETVVTCPGPPVGSDMPCLDAVCDPGTGACSLASANDGVPCDDGDACSFGGACAAGVCGPGTAMSCNDGNPCTDDGCAPDSGCFFTPNQAPCDDGDDCTLGDHCQDGQCGHTGFADCADDNPCTTDSCDPSSGCVHVLNDGPCDDGDLCTVGDHCHLGACISSGGLGCDDGNTCTDDSCNPATGCVFAANSAACDDGNLCTLGDHCSQGWCLSDAIAACDDGNPCTNDVCDPATGCISTNNAAPCDDGNACTLGDACLGGQCAPGAATDCDDGNVCTTDSCHELLGCSHTANTAWCDDDDACTSGDICAETLCQPGVQIVCDDLDQCTADSCDPENGCVFEAFAPCCGNGVTEPPEECDDGNDIANDGCSNDCKTSVEVTLHLWGAGGSSGDNSNTLIGGPGGYTTAVFEMPQGAELKILVGEGGKRYGLNSTFGGGGGGGNNSSYDGGSGGGGTFVFIDDDMPANNGNLLAVAGGGGGCAGTYGNPNSGGPGGGESGGNGYALSQPSEVGHGGTQSAGGAAGTSTGGSNGAFYLGGVGNGSTSNVGCGGGGGGYYGGGGGAGRSGAGGGGSGFINESPAQGFAYISGSTSGIPSSGGASQKSPPGTADPEYGNQAGMSFNSGSYHGNPGRAVITIGGQQHVFGYTGGIQTLVVGSL